MIKVIIMIIDISRLYYDLKQNTLQTYHDVIGTNMLVKNPMYRFKIRAS